ncbi:MAG TPA: hypothetical protein VHX60_16130 [Acidobacteriaceae bacterium]|jgi:hypothetical protein|nr:hypothetical protein [Acidobacteriaceae bacterium]
MILGMSLTVFTQLHVAISLIGIGTGFLAAFGMIRNRIYPAATAVFLLTTALTSITGFFFPFKGMTPGIIIGILSIFVLLFATAARYIGHMVGGWRATWVVTAMLALYLNFFVFLVQLFDKVPSLHSMPPRQKETVFAAAQLAALAAFTLWTVLATRRFRPATPLAL